MVKEEIYKFWSYLVDKIEIWCLIIEVKNELRNSEQHDEGDNDMIDVISNLLFRCMQKLRPESTRKWKSEAQTKT